MNHEQLVLKAVLTARKYNKQLNKEVLIYKYSLISDSLLKAYIDELNLIHAEEQEFIPDEPQTNMNLNQSTMNTNTITTIFGTCKGGYTMNLDAIQSIMEQLIEQTCSDNLRLYRNDRVCCIETSEGESFSAYVNEFGCITLNSHFTGSNIINGRTSTSKLYISLSNFETALEYNMMHYFPDYIERLKNAALWED